MCNLLYAAINQIFVYFLPVDLFTYEINFWQHDSFSYFLLHLTRKYLLRSLLLFTGQPVYYSLLKSQYNSLNYHTKLRGYQPIIGVRYTFESLNDKKTTTVLICCSLVDIELYVALLASQHRGRPVAIFFPRVTLYIFHSFLLIMVVGSIVFRVGVLNWVFGSGISVEWILGLWCEDTGVFGFRALYINI